MFSKKGSKNKGKKQAKEPPKQAPTKSIKQSAKEPFDYLVASSYKLAHTRQSRNLKASIIINIVLAVVVVCLVNVITMILPLDKVEYVFLKHANNQIEYIEPIRTSVLGLDNYKADIARKFVFDALQIDKVGTKSRWNKMRFLTTGDFFSKFISDRKEKVDDAIEKHLSRKVDILNVTKIDSFDHVDKYNVEYLQTDLQEDFPISKKKYIVMVALKSMPDVRKAYDKYINPLNIRVIDYAIHTTYDNKDLKEDNTLQFKTNNNTNNPTKGHKP